MEENTIQDFSLDFFSLRGKNAIVTGGNGGLGQAFSLALAKAGANVLMPSITDDNGVTLSMIEKEGAGAESMVIDITEEGAAEKIAQRCLTLWGSVDIVVNSAGLCINKEFPNFGKPDWDKMISINLTAAFSMILAVQNQMMKQKSGKIINICSLYSYLGGQWSPAYSASKHGLFGLTKAYADELARFNIQVNGITPGYYATDLTADTRSNKETNKRVLEHIPQNRWGNRQDLMGTLVFLASRASDYVNGSMVVVDGGYLVR